MQPPSNLSRMNITVAANDKPAQNADILENDIMSLSPELLAALLRDHTTGRNIFWATHDYEALGKGYGYHDEITPESITGANGRIITPRMYKAEDVQAERKRNKAEIFTPSWIVNAQLNLVDEAWFGRESPFNIEHSDHTWTPAEGRIAFGGEKGKTWKDYVRDTRLEITCGEGPYLTSRYDATTGELIPIEKRVGIIDRKLRVVGENTETTGDWLKWAQEAFMSAYGYEWQGDSLLLARESLFYTWLDHFKAKFGNDAEPQEKSCKSVAYIISWNLWQMDGLKGVVPDSCGDKIDDHNFFGYVNIVPCEGCRTGDIRKHNGTCCLIRDWHAKGAPGEGPGKKFRFVDIMKNK